MLQCTGGTPGNGRSSLDIPRSTDAFSHANKTQTYFRRRERRQGILSFRGFLRYQAHTSQERQEARRSLSRGFRHSRHGCGCLHHQSREGRPRPALTPPSRERQGLRRPAQQWQCQRLHWRTRPPCRGAVRQCHRRGTRHPCRRGAGLLNRPYWSPASPTQDDPRYPRGRGIAEGIACRRPRCREVDHDQ